MERILLSGAVVNFGTVIVGALAGLLFRRGIPERVRNLLMNGMALCVLYIGIDGLFSEKIKILVMILSVAVGAVIGGLTDPDRQVNRLGEWLAKRFGGTAGKSDFAEGFVGATLLFCIGAMTVVGSLESGISGDNTILYSKSVIDGVSAMVLASSFGIGVLFSSVSVLLLEGGLTLLAVAVEPILTADVILQMSAIGSLLIIALALNMLEITKIKVMNLLPAIFFPLVFCLFM